MSLQKLTSEEREESYRSARLVAVRAWAFIGCAIAFAIILAILGRVSSAVICLSVGAIVGFICSSITNWFERHGVSRGIGALLSLVLVIGVVLAFLIWLVPLFVGQLSQMLDRVPSLFAQSQEFVQHLFSSYGSAETTDFQANVQSLLVGLTDVGTTLVSKLAGWLSRAFVPNVMSLVNTIVMSFLGLFMAYWFAKDYPLIMRELGVIAGPRHAEDLALLVAVLGRSVGGYMRGIVVTSIIDGVLAYIGFTICGNPYPGLMALVAGVLHFVPVIGPFTASFLAALVGLLVNPVVAFWSFVLSDMAQNFTDNVLSPLVMRSAVKIHPAMSLIGVTVGASLGGALGMALAVPLTAAVKGAFIYFFENKTGRQLVSWEGAFFKGTPFHHPDGTPVPSFDALDDDSFLERSLIIDPSTMDGVEAEERPDAEKPILAETLRQQLEEFKRLRK